MEPSVHARAAPSLTTRRNRLERRWTRRVKALTVKEKVLIEREKATAKAKAVELALSARPSLAQLPQGVGHFATHADARDSRRGR
jgi:hypothetical protein